MSFDTVEVRSSSLLVPTISFKQLENPSKNLGPNLGPTRAPNSIAPTTRRAASLAIAWIERETIIG
jgi:hypothetical protein